MLFDLLGRKTRQYFVVLKIQVVFLQLLAVDEDTAVSNFDHLARKADYPFDVALIRLLGEPKDYDIAAFEMSPPNALDLVIDELVYEKPLTVVELRKHRGSLDDNRLDGEHAEQHEDDDDQKDVADQTQAFGPEPLARFTSQTDDLNITVVVGRDESELELVFPTEIEHNRLFDERVGKSRWLLYTTLIISFDSYLCQRLFLMNEAVRSLFPATQKYTYLNSAAVSPLPTPAVEAVRWQLDDVALNGVAHYLDWVATKNRARALIAGMLNVSPETVAFMRNTSDGFAAVASGIEWTAGDNIVSFANEFPANYYPWRRVRDRFGVELRMAPERSGRIDMDEFVALIDQNTRLVAISAVQYASGYTADLERIATAAHAVDALVAVDVIQGLGARGFDLPGLGVDIASGASHKWLCAPEGCGIFYVSENARDRVDPTFVGWISVDTPWDFEDREQPFKANTLAWESGTGCSSLFYGLEQSAKLLTETGLDRIQTYLEELTDYLCELLAGKNYEIVSSRAPGEKSSIVCIRHQNGLGCNDIAKQLEEQSIVISPRNDRLRISPHFYNNREDIERLVEALP